MSSPLDGEAVIATLESLNAQRQVTADEFRQLLKDVPLTATDVWARVLELVPPGTSYSPFRGAALHALAINAPSVLIEIARARPQSKEAQEAYASIFSYADAGTMCNAATESNNSGVTFSYSTKNALAMRMMNRPDFFLDNRERLKDMPSDLYGLMAGSALSGALLASSAARSESERTPASSISEKVAKQFNVASAIGMEFDAATLAKAMEPGVSPELQIKLLEAVRVAPFESELKHKLMLASFSALGLGTDYHPAGYREAADWIKRNLPSQDFERLIQSLKIELPIAYTRFTQLPKSTE